MSLICLRNNIVFHKVTQTALLISLVTLAGCSTSEKTGKVEEDGLVRIAEQLHAKGDDAGAADFYTRALQRSPDNLQAHKEFGQILEVQGDVAGAATQYQLALQIPPIMDATQQRSIEIRSDDIDLLRSYGRVLIRLGQPALAQPVFARAVQVAPDDVRSLNGLGVALDQLNSHEAAQKIYNKALQVKPGDFATLANLGHSYVLAGAYDEAIKLLEPHLNDPDVTPALRQNLAEAYGMDGMKADAERVSRLDLTPEQVQHNLAYYRTHRSHLLSSSTGLIADLGHFPTKEMAEAHAEDIKGQFPTETEGLSVTAISEVDTIGGTPSFAVQATGFEKTATLHAFCLRLNKRKIPCRARMDF